MNKKQRELINKESITSTYKYNLDVCSDGLSKYDLRNKEEFKEAQQ